MGRIIIMQEDRQSGKPGLGSSVLGNQAIRSWVLGKNSFGTRIVRINTDKKRQAGRQEKQFWTG